MRNNTAFGIGPAGLVILWALAACPQAGLSWALEVDAASAAALALTQNLLRTPELRDKAISESANGGLVDAQVQSLAGSAANRDAIYALSGEILADLVKNSGGDANAMLALLMKAKDNPKGFFEMLSEKNRKAIQELSRKISETPSVKKGTASTPR